MGSSEREVQRLDTLRAYELLDTAAEQSFDQLTRLAARICEAPISLVSLVDESRQWFKSRVGVDVQQTPRAWAFCAHALEARDLFIVPDARDDARFADNPLVIGEPGIRFYAGAQLRVSNGDVLGTLCVIDRQPRQLSEGQRAALATLRDAVVSLMELRRLQHDMQRVRQLLPMCAWCHSIRTGDGDGDGDGDGSSWQPLGEYVLRNNQVTHCMCPACSRRMRQEMGAP